MRGSRVVAGGGVLIVGILVGRLILPVSAQQQAPSNYLLIEECQVPPGAVIPDLIAEMTRWGAEYRKTGEYKSVRLFIHSYGPNLSIYSLREPNSWQAIPNGFQKFVAANPKVMQEPFRCASHSDNILTEVPIP